MVRDVEEDSGGLKSDGGQPPSNLPRTLQINAPECDPEGKEPQKESRRKELQVRYKVIRIESLKVTPHREEDSNATAEIYGLYY